VVPISLPPLREKKEDIPLLISHFINILNAKKGRNIREVTDSALELLMDYEYPGNVRELENILERAIVLTEKDVIDVEDLLRPRLPGPNNIEINELRSLEDVEKQHILRTLNKLEWNKSRTARILGIDRKTLLSKIRKYNLDADAGSEGN
jgi:DNA-binding NtrC family response regulator